jgi:mannosyltransferase OCH1-like enzyme
MKWSKTEREIRKAETKKKMSLLTEEAIKKTSPSDLSALPQILHFVWLNFKTPGIDVEPPDKYLKNINEWKHHHPEWKICIWSDSKVNQLFIDYPKLKKYKNRYDRYTLPINRADMLRIIVLKIFGGVYIDTDVQCLGSLNDLFEQFLIQKLNTNKKLAIVVNSGFTVTGDGLSNWFLAATPQHPFMNQILKEMRVRQLLQYNRFSNNNASTNNNKSTNHPTATSTNNTLFFQVMWSTGPYVVSNCYNTAREQNKPICLSADHIRSYFVHKGDGTWLNNCYYDMTVTALLVILLGIIGISVVFSYFKWN